MKANAGQIGTAIDRAGSGTDIRLFLLHGPDESAAADYAQRLARAMGQGAERIDIEGAALKARPGLLADEAASLSLFGDRRWIRASGIGEEALPALEALLAAPAAVNPVVALGVASLKATGKLLKLAHADPRVMALACYVPDARDAARNTAAAAREHGLRLIGEAASAIVEAAGGDRAVITRELEKIALFLDAAPDRPRDVDMGVIEAIGANLPDTGLFDAIEAIVDARPADVGSEQVRADPNLTIPMLRALAKRLITLAELRHDIDGGMGVDDAVERRRIFWKERPATVRALRRWSGEQLAAALARVRRAERSQLASGTAGRVIADMDCLAIARAAERVR